jgi:DNA-binding CsgD family transcriptional regulator
VATPTDRPSLADALEAGRAALARGAWQEARELFEAALDGGGELAERAGDTGAAADDGRDTGAAAGGGTADVLAGTERAAALEGLGWAGWWLSDERVTIDARERAFRAYRDAGEAGAAARVAAWLAADFREFRAEESVGRGWLERAHGLVADLPESADHGWVVLIDADFALNLDADVARAERASLEAAELGRRLGVADLEAVGLAQAGIATVLQGRVEEGMRRLDEASVIAASDDLQLPVSTGWALCCLISACDGVGDFPRAAQWCATMRDFTDRWGGRQIQGICRSAYGRVLAVNGDWPAAEVELTAAVADISAARPGIASGGLVRLGEHRARQGRGDEARELFERAGPAGLVGLGQLALDAGDFRAAAHTAERVLRAVPEDVPLARLPALELLARARAGDEPGSAPGAGAEAAGDERASAVVANAAAGRAEAEEGKAAGASTAEAALAELERTVAGLDTPYLRGRARLVAGELAAAGGDNEAARQACEDAVDCFSEGSAPYETAVARVELAAALTALGHPERAAAETAAAREIFERLGAHRDLERANRQDDEDAASQLSPRELEVLTLVAQGLSDAAIAERLVVSPHTVHRHVANIRAKLRLPSRAAAVAYAAREGLL